MGSGTLKISNLGTAVIAEAFVQARSDWSVLPEYPGERPTDLASAYAIQDHALALWADKVGWNRAIGGWKVGRINAPTDGLLGADRLAGPIFADTIFEEAETQPAMPIFTGGFAAGEAEFMLRLAPPPHGKAPTTDAETLEWIDAVRIGIEIASSPYPGINEDGACVTISDHGNNCGLVLGIPVAQDRWHDLGAITIETLIDGECVGRATAAAMLDGPLGAVRFLIANLAQRGIVPVAGWWISSGAVTGVHPVLAGQQVLARFDGVGEVGCLIT